MHRELAKLLLYGGVVERGDGILARLGDAFRRFEDGEDGDALVRDIHAQVRRLLELALKYGFDGDLWRCYLTWLLLMDENPFSLICEGRGVPVGSLSGLAQSDFEVFLRLFDFDFEPIERALGLRCFTRIRKFTAPAVSVGAPARELSEDIAKAPDSSFARVTEFYRRHGVGALAFHRAFHAEVRGGVLTLLPIEALDPVSLDDLTGYEEQKCELRANTEAFLAGRPANNVLLYGDGGAGKSTSVRALVNDYRDTALRMVELYRWQFADLPDILAGLRRRNYRFILFIDDLSFEEHETEYKALKAVVEGGLEARPENVLLYATSNRRHIIRETWGDRDDMEHKGDIHRSDTVEEKLSLASRFGLALNYSSPSRKQYHAIVRALAREAGLSSMGDDELVKGADAWELRHGGMSGRTARQYIDYLSGRAS